MAQSAQVGDKVAEMTEAELRAEVLRLSARLEEVEQRSEDAGTIGLLHDIVARINQAESEDDAIRGCLEAICRHEGWPVGHVYLRAHDQPDLLIPGKIWHLEDPQRFTDFRKISEQTTFEPGVGLPGRVIASSKAEWIVDVTKDPNFPRAQHAVDIGVRAGFAIPVKIDGRVEAVLEFFAVDAMEPDRPLLRVLDNIATQIGHVIKRTRSDAALREILNNSPIGISIADEEGKIDFTNNRLREILDISEETAAKINAVDLYYDPQDRLNVLVTFRKEGIVQDFEVRLKRSDGSPVDTLLTLHPVPSSEGRRFFGWVYDISERKTAEAALAESEKRFKAMLDHMPAVAFIRDLEGRFVLVNRGYEETYELGADAVRGKTLDELFPQDVAEDNKDHDRRVIAEQKAIKQDIEITLQQNPHTFSSVKFPIRDAAGDVVAVGGIELDITENKRTEAVLRENEERFRSVVDQLPCSLVLKDPEGRYMMVNQQFKDWFTTGDVEAIGETTYAFYPKELADKSVALDRQVFETGESIEQESEVDFSDGSHHTTLMTKFPIKLSDDEVIGIGTVDTDITELKRFQEELRRSEERHALAMEGADEGLWDWDIETDRFHVSPRFLAIIGMEGEKLEMSSSEWLSCVHPDDHEPHRRAVTAHLRGETPFVAVEFRVHDAVQGYRWVRARGLGLRDDRGRVYRMAGSLSEITERKKAEERFRALLESAPDATVIVNAEGEIVQINHQTEQLFGYTAAELMKEKVEILLPERFRKQHPAHRRTFFDNARVRPMGVGLELFGQAKNGREFPIEISLSPIETDEGTLVSASVRDITERKQAEEALRQSEARAKAILDTASQLQGLLKPDGTMIDANAAALSLIDVGKDEVVGRPFWDCPWWTHNPDLQVQLRQAVKTAAEGETVRFLATHPGPDGNEHVIDFRATPVTDENGEVAFIVPEGHDITDLKQAEAELRDAKERAETALADLKQAQERLITTEKMASLGQLTAGIAHEIKNPLNFVNNFSETSVELLGELREVLEPVQDKLDEETRDDVADIVDTLKGDLEKISHHGKRADNIVKSMLLHARGDAAAAVMTAVNPLVEEAFQLAYHGERARDKSFQLTMDHALDAAAGEAEVIPQEITRVLVNLLSNAFYAVKKRGQEAAAGDAKYQPEVLVSTADKGAEVEIRIRDNGIGMPAEVREKLFDPFFTTKPTGEGTGLGLSMSFDIIVQQHGGRIDVDSEAGAFTEFVITLPRRLKQSPSAAQ